MQEKALAGLSGKLVIMLDAQKCLWHAEDKKR